MKYFTKYSSKRKKSTNPAKSMIGGSVAGMAAPYVTQPLERSATLATGFKKPKDVFMEKIPGGYSLLAEELKSSKGIMGKTKSLFRGVNERAIKGALMGAAMFGTKSIFDRFSKNA